MAAIKRFFINGQTKVVILKNVSFDFEMIVTYGVCLYVVGRQQLAQLDKKYYFGVAENYDKVKSKIVMERQR